MNNKTLSPDELERFLLARDPKFNQILENSRRSLKKEGRLKYDEFWKLVDESSTKNLNTIGFITSILISPF